MIADRTTITAAARVDWLAERRNGIGASEAAAVCGVSEYETPLDVYLCKVGLAPEKAENEAMRWGSRLEPAIADAYAERTGAEFAAEQLFARSPVHPHLFATIDRVRKDGRLVELKTVGSRAAAALGDQLGDDGSDVIPLPWRCQVLHQMVVTGTDVVDVAALIGGQELRIYTVPFDDAVASRLVSLLGEFWRRVERREPPPPDPSRDGRALASLYPMAEGEIDLPPEYVATVAAWEAVKEDLARLRRADDRLKAELAAALGGAASGRLPDGRIVTRKIVHRDGYTVAPSSYVQMSVKTPKGAS